MALEVVESTRRAGEENWWQELEVLPGATFWVVGLVLCRCRRRRRRRVIRALMSGSRFVGARSALRFRLG